MFFASAFLEALEKPDCARTTWKCKVCGFNYDGISTCGVCGTPRLKKATENTLH